ncbi:MAG: aldehyde dehydrogenase [Sphingobacteriales bacterium]|nr:MAG: aldehyde dehydrogenase [Sphingobacteriales bacterium]
MKILNYINGELKEPVGNSWIANYEPATGEMYSQIADSDLRDVELAVVAAENAFENWSNTPAEERAKILLRIADIIDIKLDFLSEAESRDNGKPIKLASVVDIPRASSNFRFFATAAMQFSTDSHITENTAVNYTIRQPIGIVGCISPWNLPLYLFSWKIAPALAAGNCVIAKPSEITPLTAFELSKICIEAGLPAGVLNIVHGNGPRCGAEIVKHPKVKAISFTGSTRAGKEIASVTAPMFKKVSLELGGKNPNIIFADCDFEKMIHTTINSSFSNQGEICLCGSRILIERTIYEKFKTRFIEETAKLKVGDPNEKGVRLGAIVSKVHFEKIMYHINLAKEEGGKILFGGEQVKLDGRCKNGLFIQPTIIEGLKQNCRTNQEEIFGPVVTLQPFDTEEEALQLANNSDYGLAATIWTENLNRAHRVAAKVQSGIIWINCWLFRDLRTPFGGMKNSGVGREGGNEAMRFFTEPKNVCIKL